MPDERLEVGDLRRAARALGSHARVAPRDAGRVGQQDQQPRLQQDRDLRGQEVVVAEGDLVRGGRVVLVDHRDDPPLQQRLQRAARVEVVRARAHVEERQQHLRGRQAALRTAARRRCGTAGPGRPRTRPAAGRSPPGRAVSPSRFIPRAIAPLVTTTTSVPPRVQLGDLLADARERGQAQLARVLGDDGRPQLDDDDGHGAESTIDPMSASAAPAVPTQHEEGHLAGAEGIEHLLAGLAPRGRAEGRRGDRPRRLRARRPLPLRRRAARPGGLRGLRARPPRARPQRRQARADRPHGPRDQRPRPAGRARPRRAPRASSCSCSATAWAAASATAYAITHQEKLDGLALSAPLAALAAAPLPLRLIAKALSVVAARRRRLPGGVERRSAATRTRSRPTTRTRSTSTASSPRARCRSSRTPIAPLRGRRARS